MLHHIDTLSYHSLETAEQQLLLESLEVGVIEGGQEIFSQGDISNGVYFLAGPNEAKLTVIRKDHHHYNKEKLLTILHPPCYFGQRCLISGRLLPRNASIRVMEGSSAILAKLHPTQFSKWTSFRSFLLIKEVPLLRTLPKAQLVTIQSSIEFEEFAAGRYVFRKGEMGDKFFIITEGEVEVVDGNSVLTRLYSGHFFGEISLIYNEPRNASIIALTRLFCMTLSKEAFRSALSTTQFQAVIQEESFRRTATREMRDKMNISLSPIHSHGGGSSGGFPTNSNIIPSPLGNTCDGGGVTLTHTLNFHKLGSGDKVVNDRYVVQREIGRGAFGGVYLCQDNLSESGSFVAMKIVKRKLIPRGSDEMKAMQRLRHPNIVSLLEVIDDPSDNQLVYIQEFVDNGSVMELNEEGVCLDGPFRPHSVWQYTRDLICGVYYLHSKGVIHRDIKPDNLLITSNGVIKIGDFGSALVLQTPGEHLDSFLKTQHKKRTKAKEDLVSIKDLSSSIDPSSFSSSISSTSFSSSSSSSMHNFQRVVACGTPAFMPPELFGTRDEVESALCSFEIDYWSIGATVYCLAFGKLPWFARNQLELAYLIQNVETQFPESSSSSTFPVNSDPYLRNFLCKLLEKDPERRMGLEEASNHDFATYEGALPLNLLFYRHSSSIDDRDQQNFMSPLPPSTRKKSRASFILEAGASLFDDDGRLSHYCEEDMTLTSSLMSKRGSNIPLENSVSRNSSSFSNAGKEKARRRSSWAEGISTASLDIAQLALGALNREEEERIGDEGIGVRAPQEVLYLNKQGGGVNSSNSSSKQSDNENDDTSTNSILSLGLDASFVEDDSGIDSSDTDTIPSIKPFNIDASFNQLSSSSTNSLNKSGGLSRKKGFLMVPTELVHEPKSGTVKKKSILLMDGEVSPSSLASSPRVGSPHGTTRKRRGESEDISEMGKEDVDNQIVDGESVSDFDDDDDEYSDILSDGDLDGVVEDAFDEVIDFLDEVGSSKNRKVSLQISSDNLEFEEIGNVKSWGDQYFSNLGIKYGSSQEPSETNEDRISIHSWENPSTDAFWSVFCVFDGHGGDATSDRLATRFCSKLECDLEPFSFSNEEWESNLSDQISKSCLELDNEVFIFILFQFYIK